MARDSLIQLRQGTASAWTSANPTLAVGEGGFESDTGRLKIGDGSTAWTSLGYQAPLKGASTFTNILATNLTDTPVTVKSGFKLQKITGASSTGSVVTYSVATTGQFTGDYAVNVPAVGDVVTVAGFSGGSSAYSLTGTVTGVTSGGSPSFTVSASVTSGTATTNGNEWFYSSRIDVNTYIQKWVSIGPGGTAGATSNDTVASITSTGTFATDGSLTRLALAGGGSTTATFDNSGNLVRTTSSERYKQDIEDAQYPYNDILSLVPKTFRLNSEVAEDAQARTYGGFIAEEVDQVESLRVFVNYVTSADNTKIPDGINYGEMVSALVSAIKHQDSLISALTTRITALEKKGS